MDKRDRISQIWPPC